MVHCLQGNTVVTELPTPRYLRQLRGRGMWRGEGVWRGGAKPGEDGHMAPSAGQGAHQNWTQPSAPGASVYPGPAVGLVSPHQLPHPCGHTQDTLRRLGMPCPHLSWAGGWLPQEMCGHHSWQQGPHQAFGGGGGGVHSTLCTELFLDVTGFGLSEFYRPLGCDCVSHTWLGSFITPRLDKVVPPGRTGQPTGSAPQS